MSEIITGKYRHYKGKGYQVVGLAMHTETGEKLVLYVPLYDCEDMEADYGTNRPYFVRPYDMFFEKVEVDGQMIDRFKKLED